MKNKKIPLRTCVVTREQLPKKELIRIVRNKEMVVFIDETHKANGRGAYLKRDKAVIEKAMKTKVLNKNLGVEVPQEIFNELLGEFNG